MSSLNANNIIRKFRNVKFNSPYIHISLKSLMTYWQSKYFATSDIYTLFEVTAKTSISPVSFVGSCAFLSNSSLIERFLYLASL